MARTRTDVDDPAAYVPCLRRELIQQRRIVSGIQESGPGRDHLDGVTHRCSACTAQETHVSLPCDVKAVVVRTLQRCFRLGEPSCTVRTGK